MFPTPAQQGGRGVIVLIDNEGNEVFFGFEKFIRSPFSLFFFLEPLLVSRDLSLLVLFWGRGGGGEGSNVRFFAAKIFLSNPTSSPSSHYFITFSSQYFWCSILVHRITIVSVRAKSELLYLLYTVYLLQKSAQNLKQNPTVIALFFPEYQLHHSAQNLNCSYSPTIAAVCAESYLL
jgi:hypothetical protein